MEKETETIYDLVVTDSGNLFLATSTGLMRSKDNGSTWEDAYGNMFAGETMPTICLAYHPTQQILFAGVPGGILRSRNEGGTWEAVRLQEPAPLVAQIKFSPVFMEDRTAFAASAEDGLFCTRDRGDTWDSWNFGLLDPNLYSLAVSSQFARNRSLYTGSSTGIFHSSNGGYSWTVVDGPGNGDPVFALSVLDAGDNGDVLLAGYEHAGVYSTRDYGFSWIQAWGLPVGESVHRLVGHYLLPGVVFSLVDNRVFRSDDFGENFSRLDDSESVVICSQGNWLWLYDKGEVRRIAM